MLCSNKNKKIHVTFYVRKVITQFMNQLQLNKVENLLTNDDKITHDLLLDMSPPP